MKWMYYIFIRVVKFRDEGCYVNKRLVCGVGINDADYKLTKRVKVNGKWKITWRCPYYTKWVNMLIRCYGTDYQELHNTYLDCCVCSEWLYFSNFKGWMENRVWEGRSLDKDFLSGDVKIYSPETCIFIPSYINVFTIVNGASRGEYPLGVSYVKDSRMVNELKRPFKSQIKEYKGSFVSLGYYKTPQEAHKAYLEAKLEKCESYLIEFRDDTDIKKGLSRIREKLKYHIENNLELTSF